MTWPASSVETLGRRLVVVLLRVSRGIEPAHRNYRLATILYGRGDRLCLLVALERGDDLDSVPGIRRQQNVLDGVRRGAKVGQWIGPTEPLSDRPKRT